MTASKKRILYRRIHFRDSRGTPQLGAEDAGLKPLGRCSSIKGNDSFDVVRKQNL